MTSSRIIFEEIERRRSAEEKFESLPLFVKGFDTASFAYRRSRSSDGLASFCSSAKHSCC